MSAQHTQGPLPLTGSLTGKDPADMSAVELQALVYALRDQRDELLAALERIADPRNKHFAGDAKVVACAAIAKVKGGAA